MAEISAPEDELTLDNELQGKRQSKPPLFVKQITHPEEYEEILPNKKSLGVVAELEEPYIKGQEPKIKGYTEQSPEEISKENSPSLEIVDKDFEEMVKKLITQRIYPIRGVSADFNESNIGSYKIKKHGSGALGADLFDSNGQIIATLPFYLEDYNDREKYDIKSEGPYEVHYDQSGREVMRLLRQEGGAGVVPDPEPADIANVDAARAWLERQLRSYEGLSAEVDMSILNSLLSTISGRIPDALRVKNELLVRARARIFYHNASIRARFNLANIMEVFGNIQQVEHHEILDTLGVKETISQLILNDGEYFRLRNIDGGVQHVTNRKNDIITHLQTPIGGGLTPDQAVLAFELGEKFAHMTGESTYYDGIRDNLNNWQHFEVGGTGEADYQAYADYLVEHWDDIDQNASLSGQGSVHMRRVLYYPIFLQKPATENRGRAEYLRRYAYLWMNSAVHFQTPVANAKHDLRDFADHIDGQWIKWIGWAAKMGRAYTNSSQLTEKGVESILNIPLIEPNNLRQDSSEQAINSVMDNFKKAVATYGHLNYPEEIQRAMRHLLRGTMEYVSERHINQARAEGFITWLGINQDQMFNVVRWAAKIGSITYEQATNLRQQLDLTIFRVAAEAAAPHIGRGVGSGLKRFWDAITSGK